MHSLAVTDRRLGLASHAAMATTASHNSASHDAALTVGAATQEQAVPQGPNGVGRSSGASSILLPCTCAVDDNGASAPALDPCPRHSPEAVVELDLSLQVRRCVACRACGGSLHSTKPELTYACPFLCRDRPSGERLRSTP